MMQDAIPLTRDLVLIGGGHSHALVLKRWGMSPLPGTRLTVINPGPTASYTGMLPGFVAGHYTRDELEIDIHRLARFAGARLILDHATGIDRDIRTIRLANRAPVAYDIASIDIGITSAMDEVPGFAEHAVPVKPMGRFADRWTAFRQNDGPARIAIIGAGVGGVELSLAMTHALRARNRATEITLIEASRALQGLPGGPRARLMRALEDHDIALREDSTVASVKADAVHLTDGARITSDLTVGAAGARPWPWLLDTGLSHNDGFLEVDEALRTSDPAIYASGDCAHLSHAPRPKAGVYAVRAAPVLAHNLRADLTGRARRPFRPQKDFIKLITLGGKTALFEKCGLSARGPRLWALKNRIDRAFAARLDDLKPMAPSALPRDVTKGVRAEMSGGQPICTGCGGKVGPGTLADALAALPQDRSIGVETGVGDDAAILNVGGTRQVITTDHLRAFTEDPAVFARIAALHALGDVWAMGAAPQAALAQVTLPRMSDTLQSRTLAEILAAATEVFADAGATIVGGHTTLGGELTLGFTLTGIAAGSPITLGGGRPGDTLILTRPIGSGTLLAGDMALKARGPHLSAMMAELARPQGPAARILKTAHAMTDVTGFGLAGHLMNIAEASALASEIDLEMVPVFDGALELADAGVRSTLYPANRMRAAGANIPDSPRTALLFDPQTAGGLLAAVAPEAADEMLSALTEAGYTAACIGRLSKGPPGLRLT